MSQLTQLIEQARNRRGINDLFKTSVDSLEFRPESQDKKTEATLKDRLDELELLVFTQSRDNPKNTSEIIGNLKTILEML